MLPSLIPSLRAPPCLAPGLSLTSLPQAWILEQKEFSGLSTTEPNCYIQVRRGGAVARRRTALAHCCAMHARACPVLYYQALVA